MFIVGLLRWWYFEGWKKRASHLMSNIESLMDYFSIGLLLKTMFYLFRQDGAEKVRGSLDVKVKAFFGRIISRAIGAMIRFTVLIFGMVSITLSVIVFCLELIIWPILPFLPIVGSILAVAGWIPWL